MNTHDDFRSEMTPSAANGRTLSYSTGQPWTSCEEGLLEVIVKRANLPRRTTRGHWQQVADALAHSGQTLGYPLRSSSSCWRKAARMGLIASKPSEPTVTEVRGQASFAAPEVKAEVRRSLAVILRRIADEMEAAHG